MNNIPAILMFSIYRHKKRSSDKEAHIAVIKYIKQNNYKYKELMSYYKGKSEESILIHNNTDHAELFVKELCEVFNQESYLRSNELRQTELVYANGRVEQLKGELQEVSDIVASKLDSYSMELDGLTYWAVV